MGEPGLSGDDVIDPAQLKRRARAWRNVAASATMARMDPEWVPRPHAAHIILTYKCNLKCAGCPSWKSAITTTSARPNIATSSDN